MRKASGPGESAGDDNGVKWRASLRRGHCQVHPLASVMAGLVPAIHVARPGRLSERRPIGTTWMPGTSPGMTVR